MFGEFLGSGTNITKGLWHLNGNITDSSGNGQTGTAYNVTWVNGGMYGQCASFNGSSSQIVGNSSASLSIDATTMSIWFKTNVQQTTYCYIMNNYKSGNAGNLGIALFPTYARCSLYKQTPYQYYDLDTTINYYDNKWHNYITTYSGGVLKFYADGQLKNSVSTYTYTIGNLWTIGTNAYNSILKYNGLIDEVIFENYAWSAEQIKKYYTYCVGKFGI